MLLIGKQKPEIELTVGLLRPGQGHKSLTKANGLTRGSSDWKVVARTDLNRPRVSFG